MPRPRRSSGSPPGPRQAAPIRIIGGEFRGRTLLYSGDERTRPMKDRVREAVFNLLRNDLAGRLALDLFAGTGALGLEALSRGAARAILLEQHLPTAELIRENCRRLGVESRARVEAVDTFDWLRRWDRPADLPWLAFCAPPYDFYHSRWGELSELLASLLAGAPPGSAVLAETDTRFDPALLPEAGSWDLRPYPPAVIAIWRREE